MFVSERRARRRLRIATVGAGNIARSLAAYADARGTFEIVAVLARAAGRSAEAWPASLVTADRATVIARKPDLVVECAAHAGVVEHVPGLLQAGLDVIVASTGSLAAPGLLERLLGLAGSARLIVPAGALVGVDGLAAAARDALAEVKLTSSKPPLAWAGTAADEIVDLQTLTAPHVLFAGSAREAAMLYPKNANVAATVALAGVGFDRTQVQLVADPNAAGNCHRLEVAGRFGRFVAAVEGSAAPGNARTSVLTALSIVRAIEAQGLPLVV